MKKFTFLAAAALTAMAANAQYPYQQDPTINDVLSQGKGEVIWWILSDGAVQEFKDQGWNTVYIGPGNDFDAYVNVDIWPAGETLSGYTATYPSVDDFEGEYLSFEISNQGWFGGGYNCTGDVALDLSMLNENSHIHLAYMTPSGNGPTTMDIKFLNPDWLLSLGATGADGYVVGDALTDDWQGIDLTIGEYMRAVGGDLSTINLKEFQGYYFSYNGGDYTGRTFAFDTVYFYNIGEGGENGIEGIEADNRSIVVTNNTINLNGGNGIELYDLSGKLVKKTAGCVLGIDTLPAGVYVAKAGNLVQKVVR